MLLINEVSLIPTPMALIEHHNLDVIWKPKQMTGLIESLFQNYYVPPVVLACSTGLLDGGPVSCIDGKQRLTTIHSFMQGTVSYLYMMLYMN